jgi:hypothetical protein
LVFIFVVKVLDVKIVRCRAKIREAPANPLIMSHDNEWHAGERYARDVEAWCR